MSFPGGDFMNFIGYRNMVVEDKIKECLDAARSGLSSISIDRGDLTDDEVRYLYKEVQRRLENEIKWSDRIHHWIRPKGAITRTWGEDYPGGDELDEDI